MFSTEGVFIAFMGWVVGIPMGVFISWFISYLGTEMMDMEIPFTFDPFLIPYAGLIAIVGTAIIIQLPLMRATTFKPGDALRYQ
jgi:ABC-type antimicrobial peptide transport system permease subunit